MKLKTTREILARAKPTDEPRLVYRNLTRKGVVWSIKTCKPCGQPPALANVVVMRDITFKVSKKTRDRIRAEGKRYVHAFVQGRVICRTPSNLKWLKATYNPYKHDGFTLLTNKEAGIKKDTLLNEAKYAKLDQNGLWVSL